MRFIALIIVTLVMLVSPLAAEIPHQINYQGLLTDDSGTPLAGTYELTFTIYSDSLTGVLIWTEIRYGIDVEEGLVNLLLGRKTPLLEYHFNQEERWLEIAVDGSTLSPRMKMTSVPWALRASIADTALVTLGGSGDGHSLDADDGAPVDVVYVEGSGDVRVGSDGTGYDVNFFGATTGSRTFWDQSKMAFRTGIDTDGTHWDDTNVGLYSFASGYNSIASGLYATAMGQLTIASGDYSTAMGVFSEASGWRSVAIGGAATADGDHSLALGGYGPRADGLLSGAIGTYVTAASDTSFVIGSGTGPSGRLVNNTPSSLILGFNTTEPTLFVGGPDERVGVGTTLPSEKLDVDGGIKIGNTVNTNTGTLRWTGTDFEGYDGSSWRSFTSGGATSSGWVDDGSIVRLESISDLVGIGTSTPIAKLDVNGSMHVRDSLLVGSSTQDGELKIYRNGTSRPVVYGFPTEDGGNIEIRDENGSLAVDIHADYDDVGGHIELAKEGGPFAAKGVDIYGNYANSGQPGFRLLGAAQNVLMRMDLAGDASVQLPASSISSPEIYNEAGVASDSEGSAGVALDGTVQTLLSRTIDVPGNGFVFVIGTAQPAITHTVGTGSRAEFGISDVSTSFPNNQDVQLRLSPDTPTGSYDIPVTVHGLFEVTSSGLKTFYFLSREGSGNFVVYDMQLTLIYLPTAYGTVEATITSDGNIPDSQAPIVSSLSSGDIAAERRESEAANIARLERELNAIRAELDAMKSDDNGRMRD